MHEISRDVHVYLTDCSFVSFLQPGRVATLVPEQDVSQLLISMIKNINDFAV